MVQHLKVDYNSLSHHTILYIHHIISCDIISYIMWYRLKDVSYKTADVNIIDRWQKTLLHALTTILMGLSNYHAGPHRTHWNEHGPKKQWSDAYITQTAILTVATWVSDIFFAISFEHQTDYRERLSGRGERFSDKCTKAGGGQLC